MLFALLILVNQVFAPFAVAVAVAVAVAIASVDITPAQQPAAKSWKLSILWVFSEPTKPFLQKLPLTRCPEKEFRIDVLTNHMYPTPRELETSTHHRLPCDHHVTSHVCVLMHTTASCDILCLGYNPFACLCSISALPSRAALTLTQQRQYPTHNFRTPELALHMR